LEMLLGITLVTDWQTITEGPITAQRPIGPRPHLHFFLPAPHCSPPCLSFFLRPPPPHRPPALSPATPVAGDLPPALISLVSFPPSSCSPPRHPTSPSPVAPAAGSGSYTPRTR
jgi:hypothetical protein